jgi:hypothetical protein
MKQILLFAGLALAGCGRSESEYLPTASGAKEAVQKALDAWKSAKPYGTVPDAKPQISVFEARWQQGKQLESFEVGEPLAGENPPKVPVKMKLSGEAEEIDHYVVVGIDPLNVFREADYTRASGM